MSIEQCLAKYGFGLALKHLFLALVLLGLGHNLHSLALALVALGLMICGHN